MAKKWVKMEVLFPCYLQPIQVQDPSTTLCPDWDLLEGQERSWSGAWG